MGTVYKFPTAGMPSPAVINLAKVKTSLVGAGRIGSSLGRIARIASGSCTRCAFWSHDCVLLGFSCLSGTTRRRGRAWFWGLGSISFLGFLIPCTYDLMLLAIAVIGYFLDFQVYLPRLHGFPSPVCSTLRMEQDRQ